MLVELYYSRLQRLVESGFDFFQIWGNVTDCYVVDQQDRILF